MACSCRGQNHSRTGRSVHENDGLTIDATSRRERGATHLFPGSVDRIRAVHFPCNRIVLQSLAGAEEDAVHVELVVTRVKHQRALSLSVNDCRRPELCVQQATQETQLEGQRETEVDEFNCAPLLSYLLQRGGRRGRGCSGADEGVEVGWGSVLCSALRGDRKHARAQRAQPPSHHLHHQHHSHHFKRRHPHRYPTLTPPDE